MTNKRRKTSPTWSDLKTKLSDFDRVELLRLVHDLYAASKDNRIFLHARFGLGADILKPYEAIIERWLYSDVSKNEDISVAKAKAAIAAYKKTVGHPQGLAELMVFYCERAAAFSNEFGVQDANNLDALVRMFEQAIKISGGLAPEQRDALLERIDDVRRVSHNLGYGVGEDMDRLMAECGVDD